MPSFRTTEPTDCQLPDSSEAPPSNGDFGRIGELESPETWQNGYSQTPGEVVSLAESATALRRSHGKILDRWERGAPGLYPGDACDRRNLPSCNRCHHHCLCCFALDRRAGALIGNC